MNTKGKGAAGDLRRVCVTVLTGLVVANGAQAAAPASRLEEVIVVGAKVERPLWTTPAPVTVIDRARLEREQVQALGDVTRYEAALETDVDTPRFGNTGINIRGLGGNRVALEFDGAPLPQQLEFGSYSNSSRLSLDPAIIKRIEILRGPASALYGSDAIGGVMVFESVDAHDLVAPGRRHYFGSNGGWFGADHSVLGQGTYAWAGKRDGLVASFSHRSGDEPDNQARGVRRDRVDYEQWQGFGKWTHDFANGSELRASADYFHRQADSEMRALPGYERFVNTTRLVGDDQQRRWRTALNYRLPSIGWLDDGSLMLYRQDNETRQLTDENRIGPRNASLLLERNFKLRERGYGGELRTRWNFTTAALQHVLVAGVEWDEQRLSESRSGLSTNLRTGAVTTTLLGEVFPLRDLPVSDTTKIGLFGQDEIAFGPLSLIPGIRWDHFDLRAQTDSMFVDANRMTDLEDDALTLRLGLTWRVLEPLALYANYAEGFRAPPAADVNLFLDVATLAYRSLPNPDLEPEESRNLEGGLRWSSASTHFEAGAYYSRYRNFIESRAMLGVDPVTGYTLFQSRNLARASVYGVEAALSQQLAAVHPALRSLSVESSVHWSHGDNDVTDRPLNTILPLKALFALRWQAEPWPLAADLRVTHYSHQGRTDFSAGPFFVPPARTLIDLVAHWTPRPALSLHLGIYNLGDQRFWSYPEVRRYDPDDPRVEIASWPGVHANFTVSLRF